MCEVCNNTAETLHKLIEEFDPPAPPLSEMITNIERVRECQQ